jgi:hypothetical protein
MANEIRGLSGLASRMDPLRSSSVAKAAETERSFVDDLRASIGRRPRATEESSATAKESVAKAPGEPARQAVAPRAAAAPDEGGDGTDEPAPTTYGGEIFGGRDDRYLPPGNWIDVPGIEGGLVFIPDDMNRARPAGSDPRMVQALDSEGNPFRANWSAGATERFLAGNWEAGPSEEEHQRMLADLRERKYGANGAG